MRTTIDEQIRSLFSLFTNESNFVINYNETWDSVEIIANVTLTAWPKAEDFLKTIPHISSRDSWEFKILNDSGATILNRHSNSGNIEDFSDMESYEDLQISLKFDISKVLVNNYLSVYWVSKFNDFLINLPLISFYNTISEQINDILLLECINDSVELLHTQSIAIFSKGNDYVVHGIKNRKSRLHQCEGCIHWGTYTIKLLPEDLFSGFSNNPLFTTFNLVCGYLIAMYLFDYISLTTAQLNLKIDGFKTISYSINTSKIANLSIDENTIIQLYEVYNWVLNSGYISDKFSIARNILSINLDPVNLRISSPVLDSIKSNFRIYEKDNVHQYIQLRNDISSLLVDLQAKINDIVDNFSNDFKNNLIVLVSFFTSVIVFGVISADSPFAYFSNHIIILSWGFLLISLLYWWYSYREINKKIDLFYKHYSQIKSRYEALLDDAELSNIFEECNPDKFGSHSSFLKWQRRHFSILWIASLIILFLALLLLFIANNLSILNIIHKILACICSIKNI